MLPLTAKILYLISVCFAAEGVYYVNRQEFAPSPTLAPLVLGYRNSENSRNGVYKVFRQEFSSANAPFSRNDVPASGLPHGYHYPQQVIPYPYDQGNDYQVSNRQPSTAFPPRLFVPAPQSVYNRAEIAPWPNYQSVLSLTDYNRLFGKSPSDSKSPIIPTKSVSNAPPNQIFSNALPVPSWTIAPPVLSFQNAPPVRRYSVAPPLSSTNTFLGRGSPSSPPVQSFSNAPPVRRFTTDPPVHSTSMFSGENFTNSPPIQNFTRVLIESSSVVPPSTTSYSMSSSSSTPAPIVTESFDSYGDDGVLPAIRSSDDENEPLPPISSVQQMPSHHSTGTENEQDPNKVKYHSFNEFVEISDEHRELLESFGPIQNNDSDFADPPMAAPIKRRRRHYSKSPNFYRMPGLYSRSSWNESPLAQYDSEHIIDEYMRQLWHRMSMLSLMKRTLHNVKYHEGGPVFSGVAAIRDGTVVMVGGSNEWQSISKFHNQLAEPRRSDVNDEIDPDYILMGNYVDPDGVRSKKTNWWTWMKNFPAKRTNEAGTNLTISSSASSLTNGSITESAPLRKEEENITNVNRLTTTGGNYSQYIIYLTDEDKIETKTSRTDDVDESFFE